MFNFMRGMQLGGCLLGLVIILGGLGVVLWWLNPPSPPDQQEEIAILPTNSPLPPLPILHLATPTPTQSPTPFFAAITPLPAVELGTPSVPETAPQPATLPVADWGESAVESTGEGCVATPNGTETHVNVRDYPSLAAGVQRTIAPNTPYRVIAVAVEQDGTWYGLERGWVGGSVVMVTGAGCGTLPNASHVAWRSFGHVDFANLSRYREVKNIRVEAYMRNYPMLIFENGTIWHNPNAWE